MPKRIVDRLISTTPVVPVWGKPTMTKCSWCGNRFERYDEKWAYHFIKGGRDYWQCRWNHHRLEEQRLFPKPNLRGERCVENLKKHSKRKEN